jgi:CheY-like chemotaxis protein
LLAGCKLLLADDSITIQKVVALTFADEGVEVVTASDGKEAMAKLADFLPDVVLADVFMPGATGYEVCEYVKQDAKLKHIPVMLLVGSFEPFDEAEARRVGADEILTKPFQSIRRLIDKVSGLVSGKPPIEDAPTAEYPKVEAVPSEISKLGSSALEITTADTQPLPISNQLLDHSQESDEATVSSPEVQTDKMDKTMDDAMMQSNTSEVQRESSLDGDVLLDLGDRAPASDAGLDDFVLDIDLNELPDAPATVEVASYSPHHGLRESELAQSALRSWKLETEEARSTGAAGAIWVSDDTVAQTGTDSYKTQPVNSSDDQDIPHQLSPEIIDAIARRVVGQLSEKVVREIAWEVVPQLAELMIKRQLEEKESQTK